ncbi:hypothetical protein [Atlantibacter hermannii]|uniref:hypothetical protein n=1 Tax=Atlantibacter hermannii TaxID=565 RepID=UPI0028B0EAE0|nr:hypothetical protein [Atlantibacter hermannii]
MSLNRTGLPGHYSTVFSQLSVKKHSGKLEEGALEAFIKEALEHMKLWKNEPYEQNLAEFIAQVKLYGQTKDAAYESRKLLLAEALPLIEKYK